MKRVLIIEDQALLAALIADEMEMCGYASARIAATQANAIAFAREVRPDMIIAEDFLEEGSGICAVQEICRGTKIPTIFASVEPDLIRAKLPTAIVIGKPLRSSDLRRAIYISTRIFLPERTSRANL